MTPTHTPTPLPTSTPTATPSPTPTLDAAALMEEVKDLLSEATSAEFERQEELVVRAISIYLALPGTDKISEEQLADDLAIIAQEAGLDIFVFGADVLRVRSDPPLYLARMGFFPIYLFWGEEGEPFDYYRVAEGEDIDEARLVDDEIGIIFAHVGASTVTPNFVLLREEGATWQRVWPPDDEPWRDLWITADGDISFAAQDLSLLRVEGSSFGVFSEEDPFFECHACAHRFFDVLWERQGDKYLPQVTLSLDAPYYDRLWEITQPSPYASLFEFLRRLRAGDEPGALRLTSDPSVVEEAKALGLNDPAVTYMVEWEPAPEDALLFSTEDLNKKFIATFVQSSEGEHWLLTDIGTQK